MTTAPRVVEKRKNLVDRDAFHRRVGAPGRLGVPRVPTAAQRARGTAAYKALRERQRALRLSCWLCGHQIDYEAPHRSRWSFSLDHVMPLARGGSLLDPHNAASAHYSCNSARGAARVKRTVVRAQSRAW